MTRHFPLTVLLVVWSLSVCLTVENKEYYITLTTDPSWQATIKFLNIVSETDDTIDISDDDFPTTHRGLFRRNTARGGKPWFSQRKEATV